MQKLLAFALLLYATAPLADEGVGERLAACVACHGKSGEGVRGAEYYPHLAGKPAGYLFEQLKGFRDGRRVNPQMAWLVQFADDTWLREIADYYAALPPRAHAADTGADALTPERRERAERLVREGDPVRNVPACSACHGANLAGLEPGIPATVGLPADYIVAQFGHWRDGVRHAIEPDCMREVARAIAPEDIRAIATWLSQQSNPEGTRPAPAGSFTPPTSCGALHTETTR
ncbi:c-type cytochrome [Dokdonella sp.]|uniref:c-type cytochrome n=1 Tax=Dokdonella sp. TaxID=2291710 RepID=UPI001B113DCF|nr:c-type cytochrome [Dokdonella sp.]MBO9664413.1 cytochrome c4 [Dokdonella sp.]